MFKPIFDLAEKDPLVLINKFNELPCFSGSGAKITYISEKIDRVNISIPLNKKTKNFIGLIYGGSMYSATDAVYMVMLWYNLGKDYLIIDRSSTVNYLRPGMTDLEVECSLSENEIQSIKKELIDKKNTSRQYLIEILDEKKKVICKITKDIYIRKNFNI